MKIFYFIAWFAAIAVSPASAQTNTNAVAEVLPPAKTNAPVTTNAPAAIRKLPRGPMTISSDSGIFKMGIREAIYRGHVRVDDPRMKLTCEELIATLSKSGGRINHIVAETNVVIDATDKNNQPIHATSDEAIYDYQVKEGVTNETVWLTGHAKAENAKIILTGEPIMYDLVTGTLTATNEVLTFRQSPSEVPAKTNLPAANTNQLSAPK